MIIINGRFLCQRLTGTQRVAYELTYELDKLVSTNSFILAVPTDCDNLITLKNIAVVRIGGKSSNRWTQIDLVRYAKKMNAEILTFAGLCPILKPDYFFAHDVTFRRFPKSFSFKFRISYRFIFWICLKRCKRVFTVSEFSKNELVNLYKVPVNKITIIYNAARKKEKNFSIDAINKFGLTKYNYYLTLGSINYHKNQTYIEMCAKQYPSKLFVVVGDQFLKSFNQVQISKLKNLIYTGYVDDDEIDNLYHYASGFIFPSLYEGFGIPPLEAIVNGCKRVAISNIPVHKELYNEGIYFFDPCDVLAFDFMKFDNKTISEQQRENYVTKYNWMKSAHKLYIELYKEGFV